MLFSEIFLLVRFLERLKWELCNINVQFAKIDTGKRRNNWRVKSDQHEKNTQKKQKMMKNNNIVGISSP